MQLQQRPPGMQSCIARHAVMYRQACTSPLRKQSSVQCPLASAPMMYASCSLQDATAGATPNNAHINAPNHPQRTHDVRLLLLFHSRCYEKSCNHNHK